MSLSFVAVPLFDNASPGCGVVLGLLDDELLPGVMLPPDVELPVPLVEPDDMPDVPVPDVLEPEVPDVPAPLLLDVPGVDDVPEPVDDDVVLDGLVVDGLVVDGLIVPVLLDDGEVLLGDVLLDDVLLDGVVDGVELLSR